MVQENEQKPGPNGQILELVQENGPNPEPRNLRPERSPIDGGGKDIGPISEMSFGELTNGHFMDTGKSFMAFIAGAAVGAVAALLMAPESGAKTREKIRSGAAEAAGAAKAKIIEGLDMLEAALEKEE